MNKYILVDAASSKKKGSDFTAMWVIGLGTDGNYYVLDMVRDRLSLTERAERLFDLHRRWKPRQVRYERYGLQADIEHLKTKMEADSYRFDITEVAGQTKKTDRIGRLIPIFEQGKMWMPKTLHVTDYQKNSVDLVRAFVEEELLAFPVGIHDDMLDALARIAEPDLRLVWPKESKIVDLPPPRRDGMQRNAWMA
jgi:predicted phage terminase large subunit-like protein